MGGSLPFIDFGTDVEVASIHTGSSAFHSCIILSAPTASTQRIKCWGHNGAYQLGYGDQNHRGDELYEMGENLTLVDLGTESRVNQLALGYQHTCALLVNNALKCFGSSSNGQLGSGSAADISSTGNSMSFVQIDSDKIIYLITAGMWHTCIVYSDMITMKCIGSNGYGQLGQGDTQSRGNTPTTIIPLIPAIDLGTGPLNISSVHSGGTIICIIFVDSSVKCFGDNRFGQSAIGSALNVGDNPNEMRSNLQFSQVFSPTQAPTTTPTISPTSSPTRVPSSSPSPPTFLPTQNPTKKPTTTPTATPTSTPTTPTAPTTISPTEKPSITPTQIASPSTNDSTVTTIGLGVGIPVALIAE